MKTNRLLLLCALAAVPSAARAATVNLDFETAGQYTDSFRQDFSDPNTTATQSGGIVSIASTRNEGGTIYSTFDADGAGAGVSTFSGLTTTTIDFSIGGGSGSFGLYFYNNPSSTTLVLINPDASGSNDRVRVFTGGSATGNNVGTTGLNDVANNFTSVSPTAFTTLSVKYYENTSSPGNALVDITAGSQVFTGVSAGTFFPTYQVGIRSYDALNAGTTRFDNFAVVPEPSVTLLGTLGALALLRRRR